MRKYPYSVRWNRERKQSRIVGLISALCLLVVPVLNGSSASAGTTQDQSLTITGLQVRAVGVGTPAHEVTLSGILRNDSSKDLKSPTINLTTFGPLYSRTQVAQVNAGELDTQGYVQAVSKVLPDVPGNSTSRWSLVFIGDDIVGHNAAGVFSFGARLSDAPRVADAISVPWFYNSTKLSPTNVVFSIPLSALEVASFGSTTSPTQDVVQDIAQIAELTSATLASRVNWIVDPEIQHVLTETTMSDAHSAQVAMVSAQLKELATSSVASPYGYADIGAMYRAKMQSDLSASISSSPNGIPVVYQPTNSAIDKVTLRALTRKNVTALVGNDSLSNSGLNTINAAVRLHGNKALVFDAAASGCLTNSNTTMDIFNEQVCLSSQISMMTAESPTQSRSVIVLAPLNWNVNAAHLDQLISFLSTQNWVTLGNWNTVFNQSLSAPTVTTHAQNYSKLPVALINNVIKVDTYTRRLSQAIDDPLVQGELNRVRLNGYSTRWQNYSLASRYVDANVKILREINSSIVIQATNRITTSNAQSSIPITVANHTPYDINVRVHLVSKASERITSDGSDLTNIPGGKRVTVSVPITLNGTGVVNVTAVLRTADGMGIGTGARLEIASSTFERLARALVVGAFVLLIILAVSNFVRRKSRDGEAHLSNESVGE